MGVQPPEVEAFQEVEPKTPPGIRGDTTEDCSEDDLFSDTGTTTTTTSVFNFHDINFRSILPVLPAKGVFEDLLGVDHWDVPNEKKKYCGKCFEDVKKDLKKLAEAVDSFRIERDVARKESEVLKKEVEELKKLLKEREIENGDVKFNISNGKEKFDVLLRNNYFENQTDSLNSDKTYDKANKLGILSFSISLPKDKPPSTSHSSVAIPEVKAKKTIADLRREFFAKEFESEQKTFTANNFLEIKPEEKKETFRSKLNIRVKPKKKIAELISKLTSRITASKVIPESTALTMFQRFEKTKTVWVSELEEKPIS